MRKPHWIFLCSLLVGFTIAITRAQPPAPATHFYGIGDLPGGGTLSQVRDATKWNGTIYAVGASAAAVTTGNFDSAVLWTYDGVNPPTLSALPLDTTTGGGTLTASAITPNGAFIASQTRYGVTGTNLNTGLPTGIIQRVMASRVERSLLPHPSSSTNLNGAPYPVYEHVIQLTGGNFASLAAPSAGVAISESGTVLYGTVQQGDPRIPFSATRAVRFDAASQTSALIPLLSSGDTSNSPALRGTSTDGSVMVGVSFGGPAGANAFRYEHGSPGTVTMIPRLPGGVSSRAIAVSSDGNLTLVAGTSTHVVAPQSELYLHNHSSGAITRLGSPSTAWSAGATGGMTSDGSVVAISFQATCTPAPCTPARDGYFHNSHGWFRLESALASQGVHLPNIGWFGLQINGISADGTLVFGQGEHNGNLEGFVAEFAADYLKNFDLPPVSPVDTSIVGAWSFPEMNADPSVVIFLADGTFFQIETSANPPESAVGFERGRYSWNPQTFAFTADVLVDTTGSNGMSGLTGVGGLTLTVAGNNVTLNLPGLCDGTPSDPCSYSGTRVAITPGSLAGAWYGGTPALNDSSIVLVLLDDGKYYFAQDGDSVSPPPVGDPNGVDGIEKGTWEWNAGTGAFSTTTTVDTNRQWGLNAEFPLPASQSALTVQLAPDQLRAVVSLGSETVTLSRVAVASAATPAGTGVTVQPTSGTGTTPVTIAFDSVTSGGETTLEVINPSAAGSPAPPAGFSVGDPPLYYELQTTASFSGAVSVCFNYAGISFGTSTPRLFHFENNEWTDITSTVDTITSTICGVTTSFSPFALFVSPVSFTGYDEPVSQVPGAINVVKGGATVPLKFNIYVGGVEKTDTSGIAFGVWQLPSCTDSLTEDLVDFTTTGNTGLRYVNGSFMQNWKTPRNPGCYLVKTTVDGLSLSALFNVK